MDNHGNVRQMNMPQKPNGKELKLKYPIEFDGMTYDKVFVRRLKGRDMRLLPPVGTGENAKIAADEMFPLFAALIGEPEEFIDELDGADIDALSDIVGEFMEENSKGKKHQKRGRR